MTVRTNWVWWTYFVVDDDVVSHGRIVSYDLSRRRLTYLRPSGKPPDTNPHPLGSRDYEAWLYDTVEAPFHHLWVDPEKRSHLERADYDLVESRRKPPSFVELIDRDPEEYFGGQTEILATYLPEPEE